jgi:hypothetical protein
MSTVCCGRTGRLWVGLVFVLIACSAQPGPRGDTGPEGPAGPQGPQGPPGGLTAVDSGTANDAGLLCAPNQPFCEGNTEWQCTRSGLDAWGGVDCTTNGSATNPRICSTTGCPANAPACCRTTKPACTGSFSSPASLAGSCSGPTATACPTDPISATLATTTTTCPHTTTEVSVSVERPFTVGKAITLPDALVSLVEVNGNQDCFAWTGTVTVTADLPTWSISIDATCSTTGDSAQVVGTFTGNQ